MIMYDFYRTTVKEASNSLFITGAIQIAKSLILPTDNLSNPFLAVSQEISSIFEQTNHIILATCVNYILRHYEIPCVNSKLPVFIASFLFGLRNSLLFGIKAGVFSLIWFKLLRIFNKNNF